MNVSKRMLCAGLLAAFMNAAAFAQKVKVGYDKSADFSRYESYTLTHPSISPARPMLYASIVGSIEHELTRKGLTRAETDGDLIVLPFGAMEFGMNTPAGIPILPTYSGPPPIINATMWTGAAGSLPSSGIYVPKGSLTIDLVDRSANKVVWTGTVRVNLDIERKKESFELADKAVIKLLNRFPPKKK